MKIKNIRINNFLNIKDLLVDFTINPNKADTDVNSDTYDRYKNIVSPRIFGIIGPNSIGKSNVLEAISVVFFALNDGFVKTTASEFFRKETNDSEQRNRQIENLVNQYTNGDLDARERKKFEFLYGKIISSFHLDKSHNKSKPILFKLNYFMNNGEEKSIEIEISTNKGLVIYGDFNNSKFKVKDLNKKDFYIDESDIFARSQIELFIINKKIRLNKVLKLVQLADPNIEKVLRKDSGDIRFLTQNGNLLELNDLSTGTKLFLKEALAILEAKAPGIYLIDEIDTFMHRELSQALIVLMNMVVKNNKEINFIFTTHNLSIIGEDIKYKQIIELKKIGPEENLVAEKLSKNLKPKSSINNMLLKGSINSFPSKSYVFDNLYEVVNE